jgi:uncharacterized membrane protein required for colicin V production
MSIGGIAFNWFDVVALILILLGIERGRRRGMSSELLDVFKALITVVVAALVYRPLGLFLDDSTHIGRVVSFVVAYAGVALIIRGLFSWLKRMLGEKLVGSDMFGSWEYYLGMLAGGIRFSCNLVIILALLNVVNSSAEKRAAQAKMQKENFGDISFPTLATLHHNVFAGSASGKLVRRYLEHELIVLTAADRDAKPPETLARRENRAVSEILGEK